MVRQEWGKSRVKPGRRWLLRVFWGLHEKGPVEGGQEFGESSVFGGGPKVHRECTMVPGWAGFEARTHGPLGRVCESRTRGVWHLVENGVLGC